MAHFETTAIRKAKIACDKTLEATSEHFVDITKPSKGGQGTIQYTKDYRLSRFACYLIAQNGDSRKPEIAAAQVYFAVQTRRQELSDEQATLSENKRRISYREEMKYRNSDLQDVARDAGVISRTAEFIFFCKLS